MAKNCMFVDFNLHVYLEAVECSSGQGEVGNTAVCAPRNVRLIATGENDNPDEGVTGDPQRITLSSTHLMHVFFDHERIPMGCIQVCISRAIDCGNGCDPLYYSVPVAFCGSGMLLNPGEYTFSIADQVAYGANIEDVDVDYPLTLLFEPVSRDIVDAAIYNSACCR